jgi:MoaA/NifB/PqqE/SkfB family radical SAM enzyme
VERLRAIGIQRIHIPFHCARQDAHDWLVGRTGALKAARRAIRACVDAELPVVADVVLTRPTVPHLAETVEVLARIGVRSVSIRRLTAQDVRGPEFVPLSPRLQRLEESLEEAAAAALRRRVRLRLYDLPLCVAPRLKPIFAPQASELWIMQDGGVRARTNATLGCATCPGSPHCAGAPQDYVARFGWEEFTDAPSTTARIRESVQDQRAGQSSAPMVFSWGGPHRIRCEACADVADEASRTQQPHESTRIVRAHLVQAARHRPVVLRLVGADLLAHPQAADLVFDAVRLFPLVHVAGEASALVDWSEQDLKRLKNLGRIDVALYGPDAATHDAHCGIPGAFAAMLRAVERLRKSTNIAIGSYAILHDSRSVSAFDEAWRRGTLPGEPRFRLSARGASLDELVQHARALPAGKTRTALVAVLPHGLCEQEGLRIDTSGEREDSGKANTPQQTFRFGRSVFYRPCGSDPIGAFDACPEGVESCVSSGCPGTAVGWQSTARSRQWTASI